MSGTYNGGDSFETGFQNNNNGANTGDHTPVVTESNGPSGPVYSSGGQSWAPGQNGTPVGNPDRGRTQPNPATNPGGSGTTVVNRPKAPPPRLPTKIPAGTEVPSAPVKIKPGFGEPIVKGRESGNDKKGGHGAGNSQRDSNAKSGHSTNTQGAVVSYGVGAGTKVAGGALPAKTPAIQKSQTVYVSPAGIPRTVQQAGNSQLPPNYHPVFTTQPKSYGTPVYEQHQTAPSIFDLFPGTKTIGSVLTGTVLNPSSSASNNQRETHSNQTKPSSINDLPNVISPYAWWGNGGLTHEARTNTRTNTQGNSAVKSILDLLGNAEGTDRGRGYNEVMGYGQFGNPSKNLTDMTISEVYSYQRDLVNNGAMSSAVGRYQFVNSTLKQTVNALGYNPNTTKFTPAVQDALATHQLERRGFSKYLSGDISQTDFMTNLSKEWASLPNPATGQSYYQGQPAVGVDTVTDVLNNLTAPF